MARYQQEGTGVTGQRQAAGRGSRTGRRPGDSGTRDAIVAAARTQFAASGYHRTTLRSVAAEAGVDPALVSHFFGDKQGLFVAAVELPIEPAVIVATIASADRADVGRRLAELVLSVVDGPAGERALGLIRAAASEPAAAEAVRELLEQRVFGPVTAALGVSDADLRAGMLGSTLVGLMMARHIVQVRPVRDAAPERLARAVAPVLQHYLTGEF